MGGCSTIRKIKPRSNAKFIMNIHSEEEKDSPFMQGSIGLVISLKRAEITKIDKDFSERHYGGDFVGQYEVYSRDYSFFGSYKELKRFKEEYS